MLSCLDGRSDIQIEFLRPLPPLVCILVEFRPDILERFWVTNLTWDDVRVDNGQGMKGITYSI